MSDLNIIILSPSEQALAWLNPDVTNITYTEEWDKIPSISIEYPISEDNKDYTKLFKQGNKIYVSETPTTRARLYVINEQFELDLWKKNTITVSAEDAITELNYVEPYYYAGDEKIEVTQSFLEEVFQPYWNITMYQKPLDESLKYIQPCGSMTKMSLLRLIEEETGNVFLWWYFKNKNDNRIVRHLDFIKPSVRGGTRKSVLDVGYNMDNIQWSVDETNTFKGMAPILKMNESTTIDTSTSATTTAGATGNAGMSRDEMYKVLFGWDEWKEKDPGDINPYGWLALEVKKGETIPCSVEKYSETQSSSGESDEATAINESKEYYRVLSYWKAPFDKNKGDFFIFDNGDTDVNYTKIEPHQANGDIVPKIGTVDSNNIHKYAIYADCANKLIQSRYPDVELKVTASDMDHEISTDSSFNVYDKIWVRLRGYKQLIFARITKTVKNLQDPSKNKITISNIKVGSKIEQKGTFFVVDDCSVKQGAGEYFTGTLKYYDVSDVGNITAHPLKNTVMSITVVKKDEQSVTSAEATPTTGGFDRLGVSADGTQIMAIGKPSAVGESHYGYKYYKSVFQRKCPFCGSTDLIWAWHWASGNCGHLPDYTRFYTKCGSIEGHIFCRGCDADFSCIDGKDHMSPPRATLTRVSGPDASSETEAQSLKDGKMGNSVTGSSEGNVTASVDSIMAKARGFSYGGNASSISITEAKSLEKNQQAHDYVEKYHQCDCFGMTAYLFIEFKNAGYKVRAVKYYSQYAGSGTHRTVQIWQNGDWVDPSYAGYDTRFKAMSTKKDFVELIVSDGSAVDGSSESTKSVTTTVPGYKKTYVRTTDENGEFKLQINLEAYSQDYILVCNFGGDVEYEACSQAVNLKIT